MDDVHQNHGKLLTDQRRKQIIEMIQKRDTITTDDLINHFAVSSMTIWRDLAVLEENRQLKRIRGGGGACGRCRICGAALF